MNQLTIEQPARLPLQAAVRHRAATAPAKPASKPSGSLVVFWMICLVTLIMSHYAISARLNIPYKIMTILVVLLAPFTTGFFNLFGQRAIRWLLVYEAVLVVGCLTGYTGDPVDLLGVSAEPIVMVRVFPFLLCGFTLALYPQVEKKWMLALVLGYALLTVPDAIIFGRGSFAGVSRGRLLTGTYDEASARAVLSGYVNLSVLCLFVALAASRLRDLLSRFWRVVVLIAQGVLASVSLISGFTAAVVLLLLSMAVLGVTAPVRTLRFRLLVMGIAATVALVFSIVVISVGQQKGGALGRVASRLDGLRKAVSTREVTSETSVATSGRLRLAQISVRSFVKSPLVGLGKGRESSEVKGHDSDTHGGHSYLLDSLAKRGLLGTGPLLMALGTLLMMAYRNFRRAPGSWRESAMLTIMIVWIAAMIINPYFLGYISLNSFVFMLFGMILGDSRRLQAS
jgi:hypothetical protein